MKGEAEADPEALAIMGRPDRAVLIELEAATRRRLYGCDVIPEGARVRFMSDSAQECDAVANLFEPIWSVERGRRMEDPTDWRVFSVASKTLEAQCIALVDQRLPPRPIYGDLVGRVATLAGGWNVVVRDESEIGVTVVRPESRCTYFIRRSDAYDLTHDEHLIKYPVRSLWRRRGLVPVHGAACMIGNAGILIPGDRGSGKTTLVMNLLSAGARYLGNDAVFIDTGGQPELISWPHSIGFGRQTVETLDALAAYFRSASPSSWRTQSATKSPRDSKDRLQMTALCEIFGRSVFAHRAPFTMVVRPRLDPAVEGASARSLPRNSAPWLELVQTIRTPPGAQWLPVFEGWRLSGVEDAAWEKLSMVLPEAYEVTFGGPGTKPEQLVARLLRTTIRAVSAERS